MESRLAKPAVCVLAGLLLMGVGYGFLTPQPSGSCVLRSSTIPCPTNPVSDTAFWVGIGFFLLGIVATAASFAWLYRLYLRKPIDKSQVASTQLSRE